MTTDFIAAIKAEINGLEAELLADPRQQKLQQLRTLLAIYEQRDHPLQAQSVTTGRPRLSRPMLTTTRLAAGGRFAADATILRKEDRIREELKEFFRAQGGGKVHRSVLLQHLIEQGLMGTEKDPMGNLAAYMSTWKLDFMSDGAGNWSLRRQSEPAEAG